MSPQDSAPLKPERDTPWKLIVFAVLAVYALLIIFLNREQVDVSFEQNVLTVRGNKPASFDVAAEGEVRVFAAERVHGGFERSVRLPEFVDADRIEATFNNGLLTITIPKAQAAQPRKITIRGTEQSDKQIAG